WLFTAQGSASSLDHVHIHHGKGVQLEASSPTLNRLDFQHNAGPAIAMDLASSPRGTGLTASNNGVNGIAVPAGDLTGSVKWALQGIPYVVGSGVLSVGVSPQVSGLNPATVERGQTVTVVLSGQRLSGLSQVAFDAPGLASTPFAGGSSGQASVQVQVAADAPLGVTGATVLVDAGEVRLPQALTVTLPQPAITSINPSTVLAGVGLSTVTVKGRNFAANAEVLFNSAAVPTTWVSSTELTAVLPSQTAAGVLQTQVRIPGVGGAPELLSNASPLRV